ncbi:MAG: amidohydrolase family protein, partial [Chloroflexi bacterium]|nr:amidohydrolase family protein [Chloroflexota bacterium]
CYVGHTAVRLYVMGDEDAYERAATPDEVARMREVVAVSLAAGAIGVASSASPTHNGDRGRPIPSRVGDLAELAAVLSPLRDAGRGVAALLPAGVLSHAEVFQLQRDIGRPITWTALLTMKGIPYHEGVVAEHDAARAEGVEVWPQVSCRPLVFQMNLAEPFTFNTRPSFASLMDRPREERLAAYRDPTWRATAWDELCHRGFPLDWSSFAVAESDSRPDLVGRTVLELADDQGATALDVMLDVSIADGLSTRFWSVLANNDPEGIAWLLPRDNVLLGLADSGAHVSQLCDACFATDLLGNWVREKDVMPLERAVHKLTGEPAAVYGLSDRGTVAVGNAADLTVFDPDTVDPGPLRRIRDFPADGERLTADSPMGMTHVLVNGTPIRVDGTPAAGLDQGPGVVLRG